jgi:hypothetical protein
VFDFLEPGRGPGYLNSMALEKMRRFVFVLAAFALVLASAVPGVGAGVPNFPQSAIAMNGMNSPDCDTSQEDVAGCSQAACIGSAVMAEILEIDAPDVHPAFTFATVNWPDDFISAPPNPPI